MTATNFHLANPKLTRQCWRYQIAEKTLAEAEGILSPDESMNLLEKVSVACTVWSIVYEMSDRSMDICLDRKFDRKYSFDLNHE
jgi:hypothetical protein